jgi:hypothetical protein
MARGGIGVGAPERFLQYRRIRRCAMSPVERIAPEEAFEKVSTGEALLVCAYDDEEKCRKMRLDYALTLRELEELLRKGEVPRDRKLIFYCA